MRRVSQMSSFTRAFALALGLSICTAVSAASPIVGVGDPRMSGSMIVPYDNVWLVTVHYADGRIVERGLSTDHVRPISLNGRRFLSCIESEADIMALPSQPPT